MDESVPMPGKRTNPGPAHVPPTKLQARLDQLEKPAEHGQALVRHALGDLAAARDGLAEDELLEVLAHDQLVRASLQDLNPEAPPIDPTLLLPVVLWARLYAELERLLTEREADGVRLFTFYHGQVRAVVDERCRGERTSSPGTRTLPSTSLPSRSQGDAG